MTDELEFSKEWLSLKKYYFKILTVVTVLADNRKAFRGKLSDLCQYLSIQASLDNINNRNYEERLLDDGMTTIRKYGIACYKKRCKVISG